MEMLAQMNWSQWMLSVVLIGVCLLLMLVVLVQRGRGSGLTGAFGGAGGGGGAFGAKTGDVFTWITVVVAAVFLFLAVVGNFIFDQTPDPLAATTSTSAPADADDANPGDAAQPIQISDEQIDTAKPVGDSAGGEGAAVPSDAPADQPDSAADSETKEPVTDDQADKTAP